MSLFGGKYKWSSEVQGYVSEGEGVILKPELITYDDDIKIIPYAPDYKYAIDYKDPKAPGGRDDGGKLMYDLIPPEAMKGLAEDLTFGAKKYARTNWEKGMDWSRVINSAMRHFEAWRDPNQPDVDPETGFSHLAHLLTNISFLLTYEARKVGNDDRSS